MSIVISKRLQAIANMVPECKTAADIGTDHGYLTVWLLENNICSTAIAADINAGPLSKAKETAETYNMTERISFRLCDGLAQISENETDVVIIAGMGGETIEGILSEAPWTKKKKLVLQPQSKIPELRMWLHENGYMVEDAVLVYDASRYYVVWRVVSGIEAQPDTLGSYIDKTLKDNHDPLLPGYLSHLIAKNNSVINGLSKANSASVELDEIINLNSEFEKLLKECETWQK